MENNTEQNQINEIEKYLAETGAESSLRETADDLVCRVKLLDKRLSEKAGRPIVDTVISRIKTPESMVRKLKRKRREVTPQNALSTLHDVVGIRAVCPFLDDVFNLADEIRSNIGYEVVNYKDYVTAPKSSGYRSIHIILSCHDSRGNQFFAEIQVRSVSMNSWAILDHLLCYKNEDEQVRSLSKKLKKYADDIAELDKKFCIVRRKIEKLD